MKDGGRFISNSSMSSNPTGSSAMSDFLNQFRTTPEVVVRSKWLRVPELILIFILFMGGFFYTFLWQLHCLQQVSVESTPLLELRPPMTNFWTCSDFYGTCEAEPIPPVNRSFCQGTEECEVFDAYSSRTKYWPFSDTIAIETARTEYLERRRCNVDGSCSAEWERVPGTRVVFSLGFEHALLKIRHHFRAGDFEISGSHVQSLLKYQNETSPQITPSVQPETPVPSQEYFETTYPKRCGSQTGGRGSCMSTAWGDYITVSKILEAANVVMSRDDMLQGVVITLQVEFTNIDPPDFWSWPWGPKPKLTMYAERVRSSDHDIAEQIIVEYPSLRWSTDHDGMTTFSGESYPTRLGAERLVKHKRMLLIRTSSLGKYGRFSYSSFMMRFVVCTAIVLYAKTFVNTVLVEVYRLSKTLRHVTVMHQAETVRVTPTDEEVLQVMQDMDGTHEKLHSLIENNSRNRLAQLVSSGD